MKLKEMEFKVKVFQSAEELVSWVNEERQVLVKGIVKKSGEWHLFYYQD